MRNGLYIENPFIPDDSLFTTQERLKYFDLSQKIYRINSCGKEIARPALFHILKYNRDQVNWYDGNYVYHEPLRIYIYILDYLFFKDHVQRGNRFRIEWVEKKIDPPTSYWDKKLSSEVTTLNSYQHEFLVWLLNDDRFWEHEHNLLVWYGLLASRDKLRQLVAKHPPKQNI